MLGVGSLTDKNSPTIWDFQCLVLHEIILSQLAGIPDKEYCLKGVMHKKNFFGSFYVTLACDDDDKKSIYYSI